MGWHGRSATEGNTKSKENSELCHSRSPDPSWDNQCLWDTRDALRCCLHWDGQTLSSFLRLHTNKIGILHHFPEPSSICWVSQDRRLMSGS